MNIKSMLDQDKELRDYLAAVTQSERFQKCLALCRAEMWERDNLNADHLKGARMFEEILVSIAAPDAPESDQLTSGLDHTIYNAHKLSTDKTITNKENTDHA